MGQVPIEHRRWFELGVRQGADHIEKVAKDKLVEAGLEVMEHRRFMARIAQERNLPKWIKKRAERLARGATPKESQKETPEEART